MPVETIDEKNLFQAFEFQKSGDLEVIKEKNGISGVTKERIINFSALYNTIPSIRLEKDSCWREVNGERMGKEGRFLGQEGASRGDQMASDGTQGSKCPPLSRASLSGAPDLHLSTLGSPHTT